MAAAAHSAPDGAWNTQFQNYLNLIQQLEHAEPRQHERLERARAEVQDALLDMPAPTLTAVLQKLAILFEGELHGLDQAPSRALWAWIRPSRSSRIRRRS